MTISVSRAAPWAALFGAGLLALQAPAAEAQQVTVTNLVSDGFVPAATIDPSLINPWGISYSPTGPFWVSDNNSGVSTLYTGAGAKIPLTVTIPLPAGKTGLAAPTGQVFNPSSHAFAVKSGHKTAAPVFIFATEDGTISGWAPSLDKLNAILGVDNSTEGAVYKGLAIRSSQGVNQLYAANFRAGDVEVFNDRYQLIRTFTDPTIPAGYAPFNVQILGETLYVTFAKQDPSKHDDVAGPGHGFVDAFSLAGKFERRVASKGPLNSPWGLAIAPASFGPLAGDLLVGNFGDGWVNAFNPATGAYDGPLTDTSGQPIAIGDLWALIVGNGGGGGDAGAVYFTAGVQDEAHGLFGSLTPVAPPASTAATPGAGQAAR
jgi:uncharacterized protein (TIGR03118 family)